MYVTIHTCKTIGKRNRGLHRNNIPDDKWTFQGFCKKDDGYAEWILKKRYGKTENDKELQTIIHSKDNGTKLLPFIMKNDNEGTDHYYLGRIHYMSHSETTCEGNNGEIEPIVNFQF